MSNSVTPEHREKLVAGQKATHDIRKYLEALRLLKPTVGRPSTKTVDELSIEVMKLQARADQETDTIKKLKMLPKITAAQEAVDQRAAQDDARQRLEALAQAFAKHAAAYGQTHDLTYEHWTMMGVPADVLARAGIEKD